ncbi:MAG: SurA N-terminal domain-containing protein [Bacteroidales bacterium]
MITLQQIRDRAGAWLAGFIGLALLAFIMGDFMSSGQLLFSGSKMRVAKLGRESVSIQELEKRIAEAEEMYRSGGGQPLDEQQAFALRDQAFQQLITDYILNEEAAELGFGVTSEELFDMVQGTNPHPYVRSLFTDPSNGRFNRSLLVTFLKNMDADPSGSQKRMWMNVENELLGQRRVQKYTSMIAKGIYAPAFILKLENDNMFKTVDFSYIEKPYEWVTDSLAKPSLAEEKAFYKENLYRFHQPESRDIDLVFFDITPSGNDRQSADEWMAKLKPEFAETTDYAPFLSMNSESPFNPAFLSRTELSIHIDTLYDAPVGTMVGPFTEGSSLKLAKLAKTASLSDSVRLRHIMKVPVAATAEAVTAVRDTMSLLKSQLESGKATFAELAAKVSADFASAPNGGDLGWIRYGQIPDTVFFTPKGKIILLEMAQSIHLIEVLEESPKQKRVQIAILDHAVEPSNKTHQELYAAASQFAGANQSYEQFAASIMNDTVNSQSRLRISPIDPNVGGLIGSREIIRWAFNAKKGEVSKIFELDQAYVVAALGEINEAGIAPFEQVRDEVTYWATRKKQAEILKKEMLAADLSSLTALSRSM